MVDDTKRKFKVFFLIKQLDYPSREKRENEKVRTVMKVEYSFVMTVENARSCRRLVYATNPNPDVPQQASITQWGDKVNTIECCIWKVKEGIMLFW